VNKFFKFFIISAIFKLILSAVLPISADESYYWVWSQNLQLSYFDHPGMVAWLFKIGGLFDFGSAMRWPFVLVGQATVLIWYFILRDHLPENRLLWVLSLFLFSPLLA
jgi:4-amino-4-deoxy-L-arabinose transferase-like glycosyltransferase